MIRKGLITDTLLSATLKANRKYEKISDGGWLCDYGIEGFMVATLAEELFPVLRNCYSTGLVTLEEPVYSFDECCNAKRKPGPKKHSLREGGRVDLALWKKGKKDYHLIGAIEAKRGWSTGEAHKDIKRLYELKSLFGQGRNGQVQYAAFVTFLYAGVDPDGDNLEKLKSRIESWVAEHKAQYGNLRASFAPRSHLLDLDDEVHRGSAAVIEVL